MLDGDDVEGGVESGGAERERGEIGQHVQAPVVPGGVADGEIHAAVALAGEPARVLAFAGAGVEHTRALGQLAREGGDGVLDVRFETEHVTPQRAGQAAG